MPKNIQQTLHLTYSRNRNRLTDLKNWILGCQGIRMRGRSSWRALHHSQPATCRYAKAPNGFVCSAHGLLFASNDTIHLPIHLQHHLLCEVFPVLRSSPWACIYHVYTSLKERSKSISRSVMSDSSGSYGLQPTGLFFLGILQARKLEWVAIPFSREYSQPRDWTQDSCRAVRLCLSHQRSSIFVTYLLT